MAAVSEVRIRVPHPDSMLMLNMLGVLGLAGSVVAVGGLAGWLWALLLASAYLLAICLIGYTYAQAGAAGGAESAVPAIRPAVAAVPESA